MALKTRLIVVPLVVDAEDRVLLCRMASHRGVFPGQWALPGGGVELGLSLNEELSEAIWVAGRELADLSLSTLTRDTLTEAGFLG